jgi:hypothetical protein
MTWLGQLGVRSNDQAVANARAATTLLSRARVERDEVEIYLRSRRAEPRGHVVPVARDAAGEAAR